MDCVYSVALQVTMAMKFEFSVVFSKSFKSSSSLPLTQLWVGVLRGLPVDDEQHQPVAKNTEEEHEVKEDGQLGAEIVVVGGVARCDHGVVVVIISRCGFHFGGVAGRTTICQEIKEKMFISIHSAKLKCWTKIFRTWGLPGKLQ